MSINHPITREIILHIIIQGNKNQLFELLSHFAVRFGSDESKYNNDFLCQVSSFYKSKDYKTLYAVTVTTLQRKQPLVVC